MDREELLSDALVKSKDAISRFPFMFPLESVIKQLEYLIDVESGRADCSGLKTINIGEIAARDIEELDGNLAKTLHEVSAEVRKMTTHKTNQASDFVIIKK